MTEISLPNPLESNNNLMPYGLFTLQDTFARKAMELGAGQENAYRYYTQFYARVGGTAESWEEFISQIQAGKSPVDTAYQMYAKYDVKDRQDEEKRRYWGCFTYDIEGGGDKPKNVRIHFTNKEKQGDSPLSSDMDSEVAKRRLDDLKSMFEHVQQTHPDAQHVVMASWLLSYPPFQALMPSEFIDTLEEIQKFEHKYPLNMAFWGQFIDKNGELHIRRSNQFLVRITTARNLEELLDIFLHHVKIGKSDIQSFYSKYLPENS